MGRLDQKVAVITGGSRGIGKQIAVTFAKEGADIVIGDVLDMDTVTREVKELGRKIITIKTDVTRKTDVKNMIDTAISTFTKVDILVNNAGIQRHAPLWDMPEDYWDQVMAVNLKGPFLCIQAVARHMMERKYGKIINMASANGLITMTAPVNYVSSKAGVIGLTRACARDLAPYGINVNAIAPGVIVTDLTYARKNAEQFIEDARNKAAMKKVGSPQDIANVALFLASDETSFMTGQVIVSDGGRYGITG